MPLSLEDKNDILQYNFGVNPKEYDLDARTLKPVKRPTLQPNVDPAAITSPLSKQQQNITSTAGAFGANVAAGIVPTAAGLATAAAGMAAIPTPATWAGAAAAGLGALALGAVGSHYAGEAQKKVLESVAPDAQKYLDTAQQEHPVASALGGVASALPVGMRPDLKTFKEFGGALSKMPVVGPRQGVTLLPTEQNALMNIGLGTGFGAGLTAHDIVSTGRDAQASDLISLLGGAVLNNPSKGIAGRLMHSNESVRAAQEAANPEFFADLARTQDEKIPFGGIMERKKTPEQTIAEAPLVDRPVKEDPTLALPKDELAVERAHTALLAKQSSDAVLEAQLMAERKAQIEHEMLLAEAKKEQAKIAEEAAASVAEMRAKGLPAPDRSVISKEGIKQPEFSMTQAEPPAAGMLPVPMEDVARLVTKQPEASAPIVRPGLDVERPLPKYDEQADRIKIQQEKIKHKILANEPLTEAEQIQQDYDTGRRHQDKSKLDDVTEVAARLNGTYGRGNWGVNPAWNRLMSGLAKARNVILRPSKERGSSVVSEGGKKVLGPNGETLVDVGTNANLDTVPHEVAHSVLDTMAESKSKTDREFVQRLHDAAAQSPEYKNWLASLSADRLAKIPAEYRAGDVVAPGTVHEFVAENAGIDYLRTERALSGETSWQQTKNDFIAHAKSRLLGSGDLSHMRRYFANRLRYDAPYEGGVAQVSNIAKDNANEPIKMEQTRAQDDSKLNEYNPPEYDRTKSLKENAQIAADYEVAYAKNNPSKVVEPGKDIFTAADDQDMRRYRNREQPESQLEKAEKYGTFKRGAKKAVNENEKKALAARFAYYKDLAIKNLHQFADDAFSELYPDSIKNAHEMRLIAAKDFANNPSDEAKYGKNQQTLLEIAEDAIGRQRIDAASDNNQRYADYYHNSDTRNQPSSQLDFYTQGNKERISDEDLYKKYPRLQLDRFPKKAWPSKILQEKFGINQQQVWQNKQDPNFDWNNYRPKDAPLTIRTPEGKAEYIKDDSGNTLYRDRNNIAMPDIKENSPEMDSIKKGVQYLLNIREKGKRLVANDPAYEAELQNKVLARMYKDGIHNHPDEFLLTNMFNTAKRYAEAAMDVDIKALDAQPKTVSRDAVDESHSTPIDEVVPHYDPTIAAPLAKGEKPGKKKEYAKPANSEMSNQTAGDLLDRLELAGHMDNPDLEPIISLLQNMDSDAKVPMAAITHIESAIADSAKREQPESRLTKAAAEEDKRLFVTQTEKELRNDRPFNLQTDKMGNMNTADIKSAVKKLPPIEQDLLEKAGLIDYLHDRGNKVNKDDLRQWIKDNGPQLEVHNYGMEGKVSDARREYDRMTHEWDSSPELQMITELRGEGNSWKEIDEILQKNYGRGDVSTKAYNLLNDESVKSKVDKYNSLKTQVEAERASKDTPRATSAYNTVSALPTNEPMPEWTTSAREANKGQVEQIKAAAVMGESGKIYEGNWHMAAREKMEAAGDRESSSGYVTTKGRYVNGDEAANIAEQAKQLYQKAQKEKDAGLLKRLDTAHIKKANEEGVLATQETKNLAPKNVQRVDVVIPKQIVTQEPVNIKTLEQAEKLNAKGIITDAELAEYEKTGKITAEKTLWQPDNLHENLPNTLGWAMIQYKTGAKGEKIAVIAEAQSRWGQEKRTYEKAYSDFLEKFRKQGSEDWAQARAKDEALQKVNQYRPGMDHPLDAEYNRLILKAAIEQARKEGATHIMVSDAETAMMTEGHDAHARRSRVDETGREVSSVEQLDPRLKTTPKVVIDQEPGMRFNYDPSVQVVDKEGNPLTGQRFPTEQDAHAWARSSAGGRLKPHEYDVTRGQLHQIAEELTGAKGERVSLGEHKNAFTIKTDSGQTARFNTAEEAEAFARGRKATPRENLIFTNPDGTPKTDVSGRLYPIADTSFVNRRASGEQLTMAGKRYQDDSRLTALQDDPKTPVIFSTGIPLIRSTLDNLVKEHGTIGAYAADHLRTAAEDRSALYGKFGNPMIEAVQSLLTNPLDRLKGYNDSTNRVLNYLNAQRELNSTPGHIMLNAKEREVVDTIRKALIATHEEQRKDGPLVASVGADGKTRYREPITNKNYFPHVMAPDVINTMMREQSSAKAAELRKQFRDYREKLGQQPEDIERSLEVFQPNKSGAAQVPDYNAVRREEGYGLPPEWREKDLGNVVRRYMQRWSSDMAFYRNVQNDAAMRKLLDIKDDGRGGIGKDVLTDKLPTGENIKDVNLNSSPDVQTIMRDWNHSHPISDLNTFAITRVIKSAMMMTPTGISDVITAIPVAMKDVRPSEAHLIPKAIMQLSKGIRTGLENGTIKHGLTSLQDTIGMDVGLNTVMDAVATGMNKLSGREYLETVARGLTNSLGSLVAESRLSGAKNGNKQDIEWFNKVGVKDWAKRDTQDVITQAAARFTDSAQGTYDYRNLPRGVIEGPMAPVLSLAKWNIEQLNHFNKSVIDPLRSGNVKPLLMATLGAVIGGAAVEEIRKAINKRQPTQLTNEEWLKTGDDTMYKLAALASLSGYAGIGSEMVKTAMDVKRGNSPMGFANPLTEVAGNLVTRVGQLQQALDGGTKLEDALVPFIGKLLTDHIQMARVANRHLIETEQETQAANAARDKRVVSQVVEGKDLPMGEVQLNPMMRPNERKFKKTESVEEAAQLLPKLIDEAIANSGGDYEKLKSALERIKSNSNSAFESPEEKPLAFSRQLSWFEKTKGKEKAQEALGNFLRQREINRAKSSMVPSI